jgi:hypothetical protein
MNIIDIIDSFSGIVFFPTGLSIMLVISALLAYTAIFHKIELKLTIATFLVTSLFISIISINNLTSSRPRPVETTNIFSTLKDIEQVRVLYFWLKPEESIYMLLLTEEIAEPRYFVYPWDEDMAYELMRLQQMGDDIDGIIMNRPFYPDNYDEEQPLFDVIPRAPIEPKTPPTREELLRERRI